MTSPSDTGSERKAKTRGGGGGGGGGRGEMAKQTKHVPRKPKDSRSDLQNTAADICHPSAPVSSCNANTRGALEAHGSDNQANSE